MREQQHTLPFIVVRYQGGRFFYSRSRERAVNQMIAIRQALEDCFRIDPGYIGCFSWFKKPLKQSNVLHRLAPANQKFYQEASDEAIIQKSLSIMLCHGLFNQCVIRLLLELTKHPCYQKEENAYQTRLGCLDSGLLSHCQGRKRIAYCMASVFEKLGYHFILKSPQPLNKKKRKQKVIKPGFQDIMIRLKR